jgi:ABC-type dipeptide/oligopeptide/nickel transport system permease subunit
VTDSATNQGAPMSEDTKGAIVDTSTTPVRPEAPLPPDDLQAQGLAITARTSGQLVRRRFFRHRAAMISLAVLVLVTVVAFTSIGFGPFGGWWHHDYEHTGPVVNGGAMTLDILPPFVDGDGLAWGEHPFGQDDTGIDYFALTMRGTQESLIIAFTVGIVATILGVVVGALAGYFRGWTEGVLMRITDLFLTVPLLVTAAVVANKFASQGIVFLALALGVLVWVQLARLVRGEFLSLREKEYVEAARALGAGGIRIIWRHLLPNTVGTVIVNATLTISAAILLETALSYVGLGVRPPDTSLGLLVGEYSSASQTRPWLFWWPGLCIIAIALTVNFIGDGLRDAFDPKQTRVRA